MIAVVDDMLRVLLAREVPSLRPAPTSAVLSTQIRFQPPDDAWQQYLGTLSAPLPGGGTAKVNALNVYLVDMRENRRLRSLERDVEMVDGTIFAQPAPARLDLHYLITAWSPGEDVTPSVEPTLDEHQLLYEVTAALFEYAPLDASAVYAGAVPASVPEAIQDAALPTVVLPADGFPKLAEFWSDMGAPHSWRPAVYLVVTVPVLVARHELGVPVTTLFTEFDIGETPIDVGGHVLVGSAPVADAWVRLETPAGHLLQSATSDAAGQFRFTRLTARSYRFRAGAGGVGAADRTLDVPSPSGEYDLHLS
ncbi:MAG: putative rane protein [Solirubrobacterales bacterium]|nr:putative rane protein [Solirubrobacterales bacterium]